MYNKACLIGHLGKDPEFQTVGSGTALAKFTVATTYKYKDEETTEWHRIIVWGRLAEVARDYLKKGSLVHVEGRIHYDSYENKDGQKVYTTEIICEGFKMLSGKNKKLSSPSPDAGDGCGHSSDIEEPEEPVMDDGDEELPF